MTRQQKDLAQVVHFKTGYGICTAVRHDTLDSSALVIALWITAAVAPIVTLTRFLQQ